MGVQRFEANLVLAALEHQLDAKPARDSTGSTGRGLSTRACVAWVLFAEALCLWAAVLY
jgi:hypothetical protein